MTEPPQTTATPAVPPELPPPRSAFRAVRNDTVFCTILGGIMGYFGAADQPETLPVGVMMYGQLGALAGAAVGFLAGFVLGIRRSLITAVKLALLGSLFAALFLALLGGVGGAFIHFSGGWEGGVRSALVGALAGALFGVVYGFASYRWEHGKAGKP